MDSKLEHLEAAPERPSNTGIFGTRYDTMAHNTIDYWMLPPDEEMTEQRILKAIAEAPVTEGSSLHLYIHVPFCAQHCRFCAFSGGNSLDFRQGERYSRLLVDQLRDLLALTQVRDAPIGSVNIGGGSPDLLGAHVGYVLDAVEGLPGFGDQSEISVELTLSTAKQPFVDALLRHSVTKVSFGLQSLNPRLRKLMRQPAGLRHLDRVAGRVAGRVPVINADLITGLPGQSLHDAMTDLHTLIEDDRVNSISSYLLTPGAAPSLVAGLATGELPPAPTMQAQAEMRLLTYTTLLRHGWVRRGTNSYVDPNAMAPGVFNRLGGNECIATNSYESFVIGVGPQAVAHLPGARIENIVDNESWCQAMERGDHPFHLPLCSTVHQRDIDLSVFPLRWEGLPRARFDRMMSENALTDGQLDTFTALQNEGLVLETAAGWHTSILGEVFMGHLVRDLKKDANRDAVDGYISEGIDLANAIAAGVVPDDNSTNNRQIADALLETRAAD